jgi:hypothetical protein
MDEKYSDGNEGKCRYCGFLSKHGTQTVGFPSPRFYEVEHSERIAGDFFNHTVGFGMATKSEPMCFREKINLMEIEEKQGRAKLLAEINADRHCGSWWPYMPGLSPKEHYEVYQMQRLEQDRREFEGKLSDMALQAQQAATVIAANNATIQEKNVEIAEKNVEIAEASKQLVGELKDIAKQSDRSSKRIAWLVILLAIAQVIVGLMAFFKESYTDRFLKGIFGPLGK